MKSLKHTAPKLASATRSGLLEGPKLILPFERLMSTTASAKTTKAISPVPIENFGVDNGRGSGLCAVAKTCPGPSAEGSQNPGTTPRLKLTL